MDRHEPLYSGTSCRLVVADSRVMEIAADPPRLSSNRLPRAIFAGAAVEAAVWVTAGAGAVVFIGGAGAGTREAGLVAGSTPGREISGRRDSGS